jgi:hypothetical protein
MNGAGTQEPCEILVRETSRLHDIRIKLKKGISPGFLYIRDYMDVGG